MDNKILQSEEIEALESIYGDEWEKEIDDNSYSVNITSEIKLFITLNSCYPSEAPPTYTLLAPSLSKSQKNAVAQSLEDIYLENIGEPVLFQWIEKLREIVTTDVIDNEESSVPTVPVNVGRTEMKYDIVHGPIIQDRKSTFQGHVCQVTSESDIKMAMSYLLENKKIAQATHNISAYRIEKEKGILLQDYDDDGESHAGGRMLHLLQILDLKNILVIVTRWYGGIHLGPDRFRHINNAARQALQTSGHIQ